MKLKDLKPGQFFRPENGMPNHRWTRFGIMYYEQEENSRYAIVWVIDAR